MNEVRITSSLAGDEADESMQLVDHAREAYCIALNLKQIHLLYKLMKEWHESILACLCVRCGIKLKSILRIAVRAEPLAHASNVKAKIFVGTFGTPQTLAYNPNSRHPQQEHSESARQVQFPVPRFKQKIRPSGRWPSCRSSWRTRC